MLIGEERIAGCNILRSINPATEEEFAEFSEATPDHVDAAVAAARQAADPWAATEVSERAEVLRRLASAIRNNAAALARIETLDAGRPLFDTVNFDIPDAASAFDFFGSFAGGLTGEMIPVRRGILDYTSRSPVGVVAQIAPWNFPLVNAAWKIAPAIAMGNTVVFKPSEFASLSSLRLADLCQEAGVPSGVINIITGGPDVGAFLASHPGIDKISFTGSTATGKAISGAAALRLLPALLELGGKSPNIVFSDADLDAAVAGVMFGIFYNAGQVCTAGSRLLLDDRIYPDFMDRLIDAASSIRVGSPLDLETRLGPLISNQQRNRVGNFIASGESHGARVCYRGTVTAGRGYFVPPVIFDQVDPQMPIAREEIFGPVLTVFSFSSEEEAISLANDTDYALAAGVWTTDLRRAHQVAARLNCGTVWVNTYNLVTPQMPVPARKSSGLGVELGRHGLEEYTQLKNVVVNVSEPPFPYFS